MVFNPKKVVSQADTKNINLLSFCVPELQSKNPILRPEIAFPEKFGQKNTLHFPIFSGKMC